MRSPMTTISLELLAVVALILANGFFAMAELAITGIKTNTALHRDLFADPGFQEGGVSIHYLEKWLEARKAKQNS